MKWNKALMTATAFALVATTAVGCGKSDDDKGNTSGDTASNVKQEIKINFTADPPALDTSKATANASFTMLAALNEGL